MTLTATWKSRKNAPILSLLNKYGDAAAMALREELDLEADGIMEQSRELVPVDTGALKASGFKEVQETGSGRFGFVLGYGGPNAQINPKSGKSTDVYAIYVHEDMEVFHKHGIAKFLEVPFNAARRGMLGRLAKGIAARMRGFR